jgi:foldase protein PrsA
MMVPLHTLALLLSLLSAPAPPVQARNENTIDADPVATVNGVPISHEEFMRGLLTVAGPQVLATLIERLVVEQETTKRGITVSEDELDARLKTEQEPLIAQRTLPAESYQRWFQAYRKRVELEMLREKVVEGQVTVTDEQLEQTYLRNKDVSPISEPETRRISFILVQDPDLATQIRKQLAAQPERFAELARQHSLSVTAKDGGAMAAYFPRPKEGDMGPDEKAIFDLGNVGDISDVVPTSAGYYIFRLDDVRQPVQHTFTESKEAIRELLMHRMMALKFQEWYAEARKAADVKVFLGPAVAGEQSAPASGGGK